MLSQPSTTDRAHQLPGGARGLGHLLVRDDDHCVRLLTRVPRFRRPTAIGKGGSVLHRARPDHSESTAPGNRPMSDCYRHERTQTRHRAHRPSSPKATESPMVVATDNDAQQACSAGDCGVRSPGSKLPLTEAEAAAVSSGGCGRGEDGRAGSERASRLRGGIRSSWGDG